ncbi:MAG: hypothetical protein GY714_16450 [Desulfobacterales bacterium]|nr:hypothetical protein [Desulfobacterales bacterium]
MEESKSVISADLEAVRYQFEIWRANKKSRREAIPEELWEAAKELANKYSINEVSKCLRLNYTDLKKRMLGDDYQTVSKKPPSFIELPSEKLFTQSECIIEMEDKSGSRMKMCFRGETNFDLLELGKSFWNKNR